MTIRYAARRGSALCVAGNMPMDSHLQEVIREFEHVRSLRPGLKSKPVIHKIISFAEQDRALTPTECGAICQHIASELRLDRGPWMAWWHDDGHTSHLHLVALSIGYDGARLESGDHFRRQMEIARSLELQYGLWRAPAKKHAPTLPPLTVAPTVGGPKLAVTPNIGCGIKKQIKDAVYPLLKVTGITLPDLRKRLAGVGIELVPVLTKDMTKIQGLSYRVGKSHLTASQVDKSFTLAGLVKAGVSYQPDRDLIGLCTPLKNPPPKLHAQKEPLHGISPKHREGDPRLDELLSFHQIWLSRVGTERRNHCSGSWVANGRSKEGPGQRHCAWQPQREVLHPSGHQGFLGGVAMALIGQDRRGSTRFGTGDWVASSRRTGATQESFKEGPRPIRSPPGAREVATNDQRSPQPWTSWVAPPKQPASDIPGQPGVVLAHASRSTGLAASCTHHPKHGTNSNSRSKPGKAFPRR